MRRNGVNTCNCLPPCIDEWYEPEISSSSFPGHGLSLSRTFQRMAENPEANGLPPNTTNILAYFEYVHNRTSKQNWTTIFNYCSRSLADQTLQLCTFTTKKGLDSATWQIFVLESKISFVSFHYIKQELASWINCWYICVDSRHGRVGKSRSGHELHQRHRNHLLPVSAMLLPHVALAKEFGQRSNIGG